METKKDIFEIILEEIEKSMLSGNYYSVLTMVLTLPNICASIDSGKGNTSGEDKDLYEKWLNNYTCYKDNDRKLNSKIVYEIRCKLLHNGRFLNAKKDGSVVDFNVYFSLPSNIIIISNNASVPISIGKMKYLQVNLKDFVKNILEGFKLWKCKVSETQNYKDYIDNAIKLGPPKLGNGFESNLPVLQ